MKDEINANKDQIFYLYTIIQSRASTAFGYCDKDLFTGVKT